MNMQKKQTAEEYLNEHAFIGNYPCMVGNNKVFLKNAYLLSMIHTRKYGDMRAKEAIDALVDEDAVQYLQ